MEGDVHVLCFGVERVPDRCRVGLEGQAGRDGFAVAGGVVVGAVGRDDEVLACFETVGEGGGVPD